MIHGAHVVDDSFARRGEIGLYQPRHTTALAIQAGEPTKVQ